MTTLLLRLLPVQDAIVIVIDIKEVTAAVVVVVVDVAVFSLLLPLLLTWKICRLLPLFRQHTLLLLYTPRQQHRLSTLP